MAHLSTDTHIHIFNYIPSWKMHYFAFFPIQKSKGPYLL